MKKIYLLACLFLLIGITCKSQVTTYFYGKDPRVSSDKKYSVALYSVKIYSNLTYVTIELVAIKNMKRLDFWTSANTWIIVNDEIELPIIGFDINDMIDKRPFSGNWGWNNVKKGESYYYTMVFSGAIPPGITKFTLKDKGTSSGAHGWGFSNYTINNPQVQTVTWTERVIKQHSDDNNDGICGIYESSGKNGYRLGCIKQNGEYKLIYLNGKTKRKWWVIGDTKAKLIPSATNGVFKAQWFMSDKTIKSDCYVFFDGVSMRTILDNEEEFFLKMYPTFQNKGGTYGSDKWSGTGFALNNSGYIATNYHVIEGAKSIKIQGVKGLFFY